MSYAMNHAISAYRTAASAVPPPAAVALLLDEVLNAIVLTAKHLRAKEFEQSQARTARATGILRGLRQNVDPDYNEAMGQQFINMYTYNILALTKAVTKPDAIERLSTLASGLLAFRNAWADMTALRPRCEKKLIEDIHGKRIVANYF